MDDLRWEREARNVAHESLPALRAAADKWAVSITAILGLFGSAVLVAGPKIVGKSSFAFGMTIFVVSALAVVLACVAMLTSSLAAQGGLRVIPSLSGSTLKAWSDAELQRSGRLLRISRLGTLGATLLIVLAAFANWFDTFVEEDAPFLAILFSDSSGVMRCVESDGRDSAGFLTSRDSGKTFQAPDFVLVDQCPREVD